MPTLSHSRDIALLKDPLPAWRYPLKDDLAGGHHAHKHFDSGTTLMARMTGQ
jgi:hypothetical protein